VPISEDERFESYLRNFRPLPPSPPTRRRASGNVRRFLISAVPAAAILIAALLGFHFWTRLRYPSATSAGVRKANSIPMAGPLTAGSANAALFRNSSVKAALDQMAFSARSTQLSAGQVSTLELLGEEKHEY
jgi:hypothetical protein